jgi:hypothetical protein
VREVLAWLARIVEMEIDGVPVSDETAAFVMSVMVVTMASAAFGG